MATYKIKGARFLRKYKSQYSTLSYMALSEAERISSTLGEVPWVEVVPRAATFPAHSDASEESDAENVAMQDSFDAALFCAEHTNQRHRAYANAACYRFILPDEAVGASLASIKMHVYCDPYNAAGARVSVYTSPDVEPPMGCAVCRTGSFDDVSSDAQSNNATGDIPATEWYSTNTHVEGVAPRKSEGGSWYGNDGYAIISPEGGLAIAKYLFVFVMMENYATARAGFLEGAAFVDPVFEISLSREISQLDADALNDLSVPNTHGKEFNVCRDGVLPLLASQATGLKTITIQQTGDELIATKFIGGGTKTENVFCIIKNSLASVVAELDGPVTSVDVMQPGGFLMVSGNYKYYTGVQFAVITGAFSKGSFTGLPGFLIYDVYRGKLLEDIPLLILDSNLISAAREGRLRGGAALCSNGGSSETKVHVWALFETGAYVKDSKVYPFASFIINQDDGKVSSPQREAGITFSPETKCHYVVQSGSYNNSVAYSSEEHLYLDNGKIMPVDGYFPCNFPSSGVAYEGVITAIRPARFVSYDTRSIMVSGKLTSVGGVACRNCAIITYTNSTSTATVSVPSFDKIITPDTYESFSVSPQVGCLSENYDGSVKWLWGQTDTYLVSGAFNALGGDTSLKKAVDVIAGRCIANAALTDVSRVIGAVSVVDGPVVYAQGVQNSGDTKLFDFADLRPEVTAAQSAVGLRALYAKLYTKMLDSIPQNDIGSKERIGAGFVVKSGAVTVDALNGTVYSGVTVPTWQMSLSSLVVPFSVPQEFRATKIRLNWPKITATGGKFNVWLKRGEYVSDMPEVAESSFYLADTAEVSGWELLGLVDPAEHEVIFRIDPLADRVASLLFTAYISLDELNPSDDMVMPQGVCTEMSVAPITGAITGLDSTWKPDITLLG
jgi:hypothetical protein